MSNASMRNFDAAARERQRRIALDLDSPGNPGNAQAGYLGPSWDAFYGSLHDQADAAAAQGKNFHVDLSGIGSLADGSPSSIDAMTARQNAGNAYLGKLTDQTRLEAERFKQTQAQTEIAQAAAREASGQEQDRQAVDRALQTGGQPAQTIAGGHGMYTTVPSAVAPTLDEKRANVLKMLPGHLQTVFQQQWAKEDAAKVNTDLVKAKTEAEQAKTDAAGKPDEDVVQAVSAMKDGTVPPQLPGRASKDYTKTLAEAHRQGYDLATAATDWTATQKHIQTMNGAQQLRLNQAVNQLPELLDSVDGLASKWKAGKFPALNNLTLKAAKGGVLGPEAATIANQLDAQIADVTADLGNVYMGGNSPTDHALQLAGKSLSADWDEKVLHDMVTLAKQNVQIRQNSIKHTGVSGASAGNPYGNQPAASGGTVMLQPPGGGPPRAVPADQVDHYLKLGATKVGG
jgi:hypothetical protein